MYDFSHTIREIFDICAQENIEKKTYAHDDIVVNHEHDPFLYIFISGEYKVEFTTHTGWIHEVGKLMAPVIMGETIFLEKDDKPVKITSTLAGEAYRLTLDQIREIDTRHAGFEKSLMQITIESANNRVREANLERTLLYMISEYLEAEQTRSIVKLIGLLQDVFSSDDIIWIERHQILENIFAIRYATKE